MNKDRLTKARRSWNMSRIRGKDTTPEKAVRSLLHRMGYRFRLHVKRLPGRPDIVLPKYRAVIFVHGCFWHRHRGCKNCTTPTNNRGFWVKKLEGNARRDEPNGPANWSRGALTWAPAGRASARRRARSSAGAVKTQRRWVARTSNSLTANGSPEAMDTFFPGNLA